MSTSTSQTEASTLILTRADVGRLIDMPGVIDAVAQAHSEHAASRAAMPARFAVHLPGTDAEILPMVAAIPCIGAVGLKLLSMFPANREHDIPVINAIVVLVDSNGRCEAVLEGGLMTAYRTAAASAVATRHLAREDAATLGLIGAGVEACSHLDAIRLVRPVRRVVVWSRSQATLRAFLRETTDRDAQIDIAASPEEVARCADILCTLTPSKNPLVNGAWLRPGAHVNVVGSHKPTHREIDTEAVRRSRVVVDSFEAASREAGDLLVPLKERAITEDHFRDELGELVNGTKPGRTDQDSTTVFKSVGLAIQDIATARLLVRRAREVGVGTELRLW